MCFSFKIKHIYVDFYDFCVNPSYIIYIYSLLLSAVQKEEKTQLLHMCSHFAHLTVMTLTLLKKKNK